MLSIYGCLQHQKIFSGNDACNEVIDAEQGSRVSLIQREAASGVNIGKYPYYQEKYHLFRTASRCGHVFQIMFQVSPHLSNDCWGGDTYRLSLLVRNFPIPYHQRLRF